MRSNRLCLVAPTPWPNRRVAWVQDHGLVGQGGDGSGAAYAGGEAAGGVRCGGGIKGRENVLVLRGQLPMMPTHVISFFCIDYISSLLNFSNFD